MRPMGEPALSRAHDLFERLEQGGMSYLESLVQSQKNEELFLDYKRITTEATKAFGQDDRKNLARALSGFANSEGGVIVWGIETKKLNGADCPNISMPYSDANRFAALVDDSISGCTVPPVPGVRSVPIYIGAGPAGFVVTLVPSSGLAPHQTADDARSYLIRVGSSFKPVSHGVLAGLFGRAPRPNIYINFLLEVPKFEFSGPAHYVVVKWGFALANNSGVVAKDAYVSWRASKIGGKKSNLKVTCSDPQRWQVDALSPRMGSCLAKDGNRLAPFSIQETVTFTLIYDIPIEEDFHIEMTFGCQGAPPQRDLLHVDKDVISSIINRMDEFCSHTDVPEQMLHEWSSQLLGIEDRMKLL